MGDKLQVEIFEPFAAYEAGRWRRRIFPGFQGWIDVTIRARVKDNQLQGILRIYLYRGRDPEFKAAPDHPLQDSLTLDQMLSIAIRPEYWERIGQFAWVRLRVWIDTAR